MATVLRIEFQRLLSELVARSATQQVVEAASSADLIRFENPAFHDRLQRAIVNATVRPLEMTTGLMTVTGSFLSTLAIGLALAFIDPLFALLAVVAGIPVTLSNLRVGRALYPFDVEQTPTDRERNYVQNLLVGKDAAKDLRAYNLTGYLKARFDSLYARRIDALRTLISETQRPGCCRWTSYCGHQRQRPRSADCLRERRWDLPCRCRSGGCRPNSPR